MKKNKEIINKIIKYKIAKNTFIKMLVCTFVFVIGFTVGCLTMFKLNDDYTSEENNKYTDEIINNFNYIKDNYYKDIDEQTLVDGAINGMLSELDDDHALFLDAATEDTFNKTIDGSYEGIGVEVFNDNDNNIIVLRVFEDSPAEKAGLESLDKIIAVNDLSMLGKDSSVLSEEISDINLEDSIKIEYERGEEKKTVEVKKDYLIIPSVTSKIYNEADKTIGYIYIEQFSATTFAQFEEALTALEKNNIYSLIIDVRGNTGGHLSVVEDILSLFLDSKHVIYQIEDQKDIVKYYSSGDKTVEYNIIVLQNESSASASELLSSSLNEQLGSVIIGTNSYGKGTVQEVIGLNSGNEYKFTSKKWLTSNGNWIDEIGVEPTIEIKLNEKYFETFDEVDDNQLQRAIKEATK